MGSIRRVTHFAPIERSALADLMLAVGPDAPTLCAGWTTRDLAAHLVVRLTRVDAAGGIVIPALRPHLKRVQDTVAGQDWATLVGKVRRRPWWAAAASTRRSTGSNTSSTTRTCGEPNQGGNRGD